MHNRRLCGEMVEEEVEEDWSNELEEEVYERLECNINNMYGLIIKYYETI